MRISRQQFRIAARSLGRHRGFAATAIVSLALAIALNTTMYSVLDAMISPKLDLRAPDRLYSVQLWGDFKHKVDDATRASLIRSASASFAEVSHLEMAGRGELTVELGQHFARTTGAIVAPNFFRMLGTRAARGRIFTDADYSAETPTLLIS